MVVKSAYQMGELYTSHQPQAPRSGRSSGSTTTRIRLMYSSFVRQRCGETEVGWSWLDRWNARADIEGGRQ